MPLTAKFERRLLLAFAAASLACAPAGREGDSIAIADESAIIVWDAQAKIQHFIRKADFRTTAKDFGFLVPTPTAPTLGESDNEAFGYLARLTAPKTVWRMESNDSKGPAVAKAEAKKSAEVKVLEEKKVAGYDAAVLEASNADALDAWLKKNGYHSSPALVEWFKPYIAQKWKITAFKISKDGPDDRASARAVKMSFATDRPFSPYREPSAGTPVQSDRYFPPRLLRVYFISDSRVDGRIGTTADWPGATVWSGLIDGKARGELVGFLKLPVSAANASVRLTEFEDRSDPRPGTDDLFFGTAASQAMVTRPDIVKEISIAGIFAMLVFAGIFCGLLYGLWKFLVVLVRFFRKA